MPLTPPNVKVPQKETWGGFSTATLFSGAVAPTLTAAPGAVAVGSDVLLASGCGRLDTITLNPPFSSGLNLGITFYDAGIAVSGGPIPASGHKIVGWTPAVVPAVSGIVAVSGQVTIGFTDLLAGVPRQVSVPFQSGLCFNSRSGQPGFTVAWSYETSTQ